MQPRASPPGAGRARSPCRLPAPRVPGRGSYLTRAAEGLFLPVARLVHGHHTGNFVGHSLPELVQADGVGRGAPRNVLGKHVPQAFVCGAVRTEVQGAHLPPRPGGWTLPALPSAPCSLLNGHHQGCQLGGSIFPTSSLASGSMSSPLGVGALALWDILLSPPCVSLTPKFPLS